MRSSLNRRTAGLLVLPAALLALAGGVAYATTPDASGVYTACMLKNVGTIRLIDPSLPASSLLSHCTSLETPITWNQQGQPGPQGPAGPTGTDGTNGKDGVSPTVTQLAPGDPNCTNGGAAIKDADGSTAYVCNGTDGKDGQPFAGTFTSPNGQFSVTVADSGITLTGPSGSIKLDAVGLDLNGALITLNGAGSCAPAARQGDQVTANLQGIAGPISAAIAQGSPTVCIGP
jgi:hypothetical protein